MTRHSLERIQREIDTDKDHWTCDEAVRNRRQMCKGTWTHESVSHIVSWLKC